jgi:hypothetical protein
LLRLVEALEFASIANNTVGGYRRTAVFLPDGSEWYVKDSFFENVLKPKIRLGEIPALGDRGDFLERVDEDEEVSPRSEPKKPTNEPPEISGTLETR